MIMNKPKRTDDKYWTGTRNFDHLQFEGDLEEYIETLFTSKDMENFAAKCLILGHGGKDTKALLQEFIKKDMWKCSECGETDTDYCLCV
jgi:hypothetical protein